MLSLIHMGRIRFLIVFRFRIANIKVHVVQKSPNLRPEVFQSKRNFTTAACIRVDSLTVLFAVVVVEEVNEMEKIIEHRRESSRYILVLLFLRLMISSPHIF
jgi:hypothetical protein